MTYGSDGAQVLVEIHRSEVDAKLRSLKIKRWLRTDELALYLGTSQGAIRNMVLRGKLRAKKCFGRNFFDREYIDEMIESSSWAGEPTTRRRGRCR